MERRRSVTYNSTVYYLNEMFTSKGSFFFRKSNTEWKSYYYKEKEEMRVSVWRKKVYMYLRKEGGERDEGEEQELCAWQDKWIHY